MSKKMRETRLNQELEDIKEGACFEQNSEVDRKEEEEGLQRKGLYKRAGG